MAKRIFLLIFSVVVTLAGTVSYSQTGSGQNQEILQLSKALKESPEGPERVKALLDLSEAFQRTDPQKARNYADQSLSLSREINFPEGIAESLNQFGRYYFFQGDYKQALEYYFKSLKTSEDKGYKKGISFSYNNIGIIYKNQGNYPIALDYYLKGLKISIELGDKRGVSTSYSNIGSVHFELKNYKPALEFYFKSKKVFKEIGLKAELSETLLGMGLCYQALGETGKGLDYLTRALKLAQTVKHAETIKSAAGELSRSYARAKQFQSAYRNHVLFKEKSDSLINEEKTKRITQLEMQYGFDKKQRQQLLKYTFSGFAVILALVFYARFRLKVNANRRLNMEIDERTETQRKLGESEEKFRALSEKSMVGICIIQADTIRYANPRLLELFSYPGDQLIGKSPLDLVVEGDKDQVTENFDKQITGAVDFKPFEFRGITKEGDIIYLEAHGTLTQYLDNPALMETLIDITDRKTAEQDLLKSIKLESVGILSGGIAHDFNNLLSVIIGNLEMSKETLHDPDSDSKSFLDNAEKASHQAAELVNKLLTISRGGWMMKDKIYLNDIFKQMAHFSEKLKDFSYSLVLENNLKPLYGDGRQLRQVMENLLLNAHEATEGIEDDESVGLSAKNASLETDNQWFLKEGGYLKVSVMDNGKGIPSHLMGKIFDPYFSTKERGNQKGMGMGLAICQAIVRKHDGHITITPRLPKGTQVDVFLPVYNEDTEPDKGTVIEKSRERNNTT
ncbi:MAG: tetratricopeptide repeat protein [bacterium]|nr:tetratricopeptide repeat protein [bacterium]